MKTRLNLVLILALAISPGALAGSATWNAHPSSSDWNTASNWTPATVPNGASDIASFGVSSNRNVALSSSVEVNSMVFNAGASAFTITSFPAKAFTLSGAGIVNNSGITQLFLINQDQSGDFKGIDFTNGASAGSGTTFTLIGGEPFYGYGGQINFNDTSGADHGIFDVYGSEEDGLGGANIVFFDNSTAGNGTFTTHQGPGHDGEISIAGTATAGDATFNNDGTMAFAISGNGGNAVITNTNTIFIYNSSKLEAATITNKGELSSGAGHAGYTEIRDTVNAGTSTIINEGGTGNGAFGGSTQFRPASPTAADSLLIANGGIDGGGGGRVAFGEFGGGTATAANATLVANGGTNGGEGGQLIFDADTLGGTAHVQLFGNGFLDISLHNLPGLTIGSLTGNGPVFLGGNNLTIGSSNEATTFDGVLQDGSENGGTGGSLSKIGTGKLTLTAANTYTGGTTVNGGTLLVNNTTGSGVGTGQVQAFSGILGGSGVISGRVTMGTGHGAGATLGPGANSIVPGTLTIRKQLALKSDATYRVTLNSSTPAADQVIANGVRILGAQIVINETHNAALPPGTVFTVISNTSRKPISGTFANLADGASIEVGANFFQANYEGGDGNDLTLTVVPCCSGAL